MFIAGLRKFSLVDYPGKVAAVVFTPYCNMRCTYCHNYHILGAGTQTISTDEVTGFLQKRAGFLDAVVISGGEPTLRPDLPEFIRLVREMGYLIKLDTNGTNPKQLLSMIREGLIDFVAMDIKAPVSKYREITQVDDDLSSITKSINIIKNCGLDYEFRTTFAPQLTSEDIEQIAREITPAKSFILQQYVPRKKEDPPAHSSGELERAADLARDILGVCLIRND